MCEDEITRKFRSLQEQGMVEREDLEGTGGDYAEIVKNVLRRLRGGRREQGVKVSEYFLAHPEAPSNLIPGETDPGDRPNYSSP